MTKNKKNLIEVCIEDLEYPIKVGKKAKFEVEHTLVTISIRAKIEKEFKDQFEENILRIVNNTREYTGPQQLSSNLIRYLDSIDAKTARLNFKYPFFLERKLPASQQKYLMKYICQLTLTKTFPGHYIKKYTIEIPVISKEYIIPGIQRDILEIPVSFVVEMEGDIVFFPEDLIDMIERKINSGYFTPLSVFEEDIKLLLLKKIEKELYKEFYADKCTIKIITRKRLYTFSSKLVSCDYEINNKHEYEIDHMFI